MASEQLKISVIQPDIVWEDKEANLRQYETYLSGVAEKQVVILPEMFSTGFSMQPAGLAEPMDGPTLQWMRAMAAKHHCILTGSLIIEEGGQYFNRLVWMQPDGRAGHYDKRHLFAYGGEDKEYSAGNRKLMVSVSGWKISLMICYDLRFPVWARQPAAEGPGAESAYDILVYVANWPERRSLAWSTLLQARAIENQCYVFGANRVGVDGNGLVYAGGSAGFGPLGEPLWQPDNRAAVFTATADRHQLDQLRQDLPFLKDGDRFVIL